MKLPNLFCVFGLHRTVAFEESTPNGPMVYRQCLRCRAIIGNGVITHSSGHGTSTVCAATVTQVLEKVRECRKPENAHLNPWLGRKTC